MSYEDQPPSYSANDYAYNASGAINEITVDGLQQSGYPGQRQNITNSFITRSEGTRNARNVIGITNASNTFSGFIDVLYDQRKLPSGFAKNMLYKIGLLLYYSAQSIYSIAVAQKEHLPYHLIYIMVSLTGFLVECIITTMYVKKRLTQGDREAENTRHNQVHHTSQPREAWASSTLTQRYHYKARSLFVEHTILSLAEFLIYPTLICNLYGLINERSKFENKLFGFNSLFFAYSVIMDALYMKLYLIWLVTRAVYATYDKYDELVQPMQVEWKRYFTPVYLTIPLAAMTALTHWIMTGLIGVRIYVDNLTFNYTVASLTGYMIGCAIYLPIMSWITYIIINKLWFYEVYSAINQMSNGADRMPPQDTWDEKLFASIRDPQTYMAIAFLMIPFIAFTVGAYLPDYLGSRHEIVSNARNAVEGLTPCFIVSFLLSNLQATIMLLILPCGLPLLWLCFICINK